MRSESDVTLVRPLDNERVAARLITGVTIDEVDEAVGLWSPYLHKTFGLGSQGPQHAHWRWDRKARAVKGMSQYTLCGIAIADEMQALMLREDTFARAKHPDQKGTGIVYISFLSTAPWNDPEIVPTPSYRGCGTHLVIEAVKYSDMLGYGGRLGLHSLPQAERFYRDRCGMADLGPDPDPAHQNLRYFEFTKDAARIFLEGLR